MMEGVKHLSRFGKSEEDVVTMRIKALTVGIRDQNLAHSWHVTDTSQEMEIYCAGQ